MTTDPYTVRIFVKEGDPEGVRIIDQMNWTGQAVVFPREKWPEVRRLREFELPGVYILSGFAMDDADLPTVYVGEGDGMRGRIDQHFQGKDFWTTCIAFVSKNDGLNKAHIQWLEYALVKQAKEVQRCKLDNGNVPQEPALGDGEKAGTRTFWKEILKILPLAGLHAFEAPKVIVSAQQKPDAQLPTPTASSEPDTIVVPALKDGFQDVFIGENCWYAIRISGGMLTKIKWIAAYQSQPISAVTHVAPVKHIEPYGDSGKYKVVFAEPAKPIKLIPYGDAPSGFMQGPRYTTYARLMAAEDGARPGVEVTLPTGLDNPPIAPQRVFGRVRQRKLEVVEGLSGRRGAFHHLVPCPGCSGDRCRAARDGVATAPETFDRAI